jgi:hypothetical protein
MPSACGQVLESSLRLVSHSSGEDTVKLYRQILKPPVSLAYKLTHIDMGIDLCHYAVACTHFGKPFRFRAGGKGEEKKGYEFMGEVN